ncbi:MAG: hypothetical protein CMG61_06750 [Candidatus Marinimicrobia bacterium]|nr:hypothetical protein [Candidatus Neomarinimicrobiota bacterium]|tara:strand:+ start:27410 stop:28336 length:927 start_codon:yes stop_codon:yes gene_type:complete
MAELIIMFREVLEASLIIGILYTYLNKSGNNDSIKMVWSGVAVAVLASIVIALIFGKLAIGLKDSEAKIFEGVVMIIASIVLTTMIIWMARNKNISEDLKNKAKEAISSGFKYGIFTLAFVAVFREGVEIILLLWGAGKDGINVVSSVIGALLGLAGGYAIFVQGVKFPLKQFFNITSVLLIFVAAGMLTYGVHELESGGVIPYYGGKTEIKEDVILATRANGDSKTFNYTIENEKKAKKWASRIWDINPQKNSDGSYPILHDKGAIGGLIKGFFGYNGDPSLIEFVTWILSIIGLNFLYQKVGKRKI